ncbi:hypothetical protein D9M72_479520 [compost metagenome]
MYSPAPRIFTLGRFSVAAISGRATISAPPPSDTTQQSSLCSGSAIIGEFSTSCTVTTSRSIACGLYCAWCDAATLTHASCSGVVPYSYIWRIATIAYRLTVTGLNGASNGASGRLAPQLRACVPVEPSERGRPASVISATLHLPAAMACAACETCTR